MGLTCPNCGNKEEFLAAYTERGCCGLTLDSDGELHDRGHNPVEFKIDEIVCSACRFPLAIVRP
jgi:hypothetical protein